MTFKYQTYFPHPKIRDAQTYAIDKILDAYINKNKSTVILEAGTGVGKSAIAMTVARYLTEKFDNNEEENYEQGSYFLTTQKILQKQYTKDFGKPKGRMCSIESSSNYGCSYHKKNTCQESQRMLRAESSESRFFKACVFNCKYKNAKKDFIESSESVTNFPYFVTESTYSRKILPRKFLVIDESHNAESELSKFIEVKISERFCKSTLKLSWPNQTTQFQVVKWINEIYFPKVKSQLLHFEKMLKKTGLKERISEFTSVSRQYDMLSSHVEKIDTFLSHYDKDNWVMEEIEPEGRSQRKFSFRAIDISPFAKNYLLRMGKRSLLMSATILDKDTFCKSLGLDISDVEFISIDTPFSEENRPVYVYPIGSMSAKYINSTLPKMASAIKEILKSHKGEKGIIHCHTFRIANYIKKNIRSKRLLIHNSENRDRILNRHITSSENTVLLSPSMCEGVDLKDDLSRFQIIVKVPYPYLGDPLIRKRMNKWEKWYPLQTAKTIVQAAGRSIRSESDSATTYILDSDWDRFYNRNRYLFPQTFKKSLK